MYVYIYIYMYYVENIPDSYVFDMETIAFSYIFLTVESTKIKKTCVCGISSTFWRNDRLCCDPLRARRFSEYIIMYAGGEGIIRNGLRNIGYYDYYDNASSADGLHRQWCGRIVPLLFGPKCADFWNECLMLVKCIRPEFLKKRPLPIVI